MKIVILENMGQVPCYIDHGVVWKRCRVIQTGFCTYREGIKTLDYSNFGYALLEPKASERAFDIWSPCWHLDANSGVHCPRCLIKLLQSGKRFFADYKGDLFYEEHKSLEPMWEDGLSPARKLHWGHSGTIGKCYRCAGHPEDHPEW